MHFVEGGYGSAVQRCEADTGGNIDRCEEIGWKGGCRVLCSGEGLVAGSDRSGCSEQRLLGYTISLLLVTSFLSFHFIYSIFSILYTALR